jgi:small-conductance mechanosensitive channel
MCVQVSTLAQTNETTAKSAISFLASTNDSTAKNNTVLSMVFEELGELQELESQLARDEVSLEYEKETQTPAEITRTTKETERDILISDLQATREELNRIQEQIYVLRPTINQPKEPNTTDENQTDEEKKAIEDEKAQEKEKQVAEKNVLLETEKTIKEKQKIFQTELDLLDKKINELEEKIPQEKIEKATIIESLETNVQSLNQLIEKQKQLIRQQAAGLASSIVFIISILLFLFLLRWVIIRLIKQLHMPLSRKATLSHIAKITFNIIIGIIAMGLVFSQFTNILPFILLLGTGLAFAVRDSISSFIGWFIIGSESGFHINDIIALGNTHGRVKEINLLTSVITEIDVHGETGKQISIPNKFIFEKALINHSRNYGLARIMISIDIDWGTDITHTQNALMTALNKTIESLLEQAEFSHQNYKNKLERGKMHPQIDIESKQEKLTLHLICFFPTDLANNSKQEIVRHFNQWLYKQKNTKI